jgi:DNA invertase Pin-like site-specific DNA recombinase
MKHYIAYYRVSTTKQGASGLGLEAQRASVRAFAHSDDAIIAEYTEVESGKRDSREQLQAAIAGAKQHGATLIIAKLDRLSRNAGFIFTLRDSGVNFVCADMPDANTLTIGIFATLAQHERELISQRTKAALAVKKAQGFRLGSPHNLQSAARVKSAAVRKQQAQSKQSNRIAKHFAVKLRAEGKSLRAIAQELNDSGLRSSLGGTFYASTVQHLLSL